MSYKHPHHSYKTHHCLKHITWYMVLSIGQSWCRLSWMLSRLTRGMTRGVTSGLWTQWEWTRTWSCTHGLLLLGFWMEAGWCSDWSLSRTWESSLLQRVKGQTAECFKLVHNVVTAYELMYSIYRTKNVFIQISYIAIVNKQFQETYN